MTRLFLAIDLDAAARAEAVGWVQRLTRTLGTARTRQVKWVEPANLHVTLHFLGSLDERQAARVAAALSAAPAPVPASPSASPSISVSASPSATASASASTSTTSAQRSADVYRTPAFDLQLGAAGTFPAGGPPRIVWLGLRDARQSAARLYDELRARLDPLALPGGRGGDDERRPFTPHLTVGRARERSVTLGRDLRAALARLDTPSSTFAVPAFTLYASHLSSSGPTYTIVQRFPLPARGWPVNPPDQAIV